MPDHPSVEESRRRLEGLGWSAAGEGQPGAGGRHWVIVRSGDGSLAGEGDSREEAWQAAAEAAEGGVSP